MASLQILREEAGLLRREEYNRRKAAKSAIKSVEDGHWDLVPPYLPKISAESKHRSLSFLVARQQFLEMVDSGESSKAFAFFMKRIKPMEDTISKKDFTDLLYLATAKSVADAASTIPGLSDWNVEKGRRLVASQLRKAADQAGDYGLETEAYFHQHGIQPVGEQLSRLVQQAYSYQLLVASGVVIPQALQRKAPVSIRTVVKDVTEHLPPVNPFMTIETRQSLSAIQVFPIHNVLLTGASDGSVTLWDLDDDEVVRQGRGVVLGKHNGKVWQLASGVYSGTDRELGVSCGADGYVLLWDIKCRQCQGTLHPSEGDVFSVAIAPGLQAIACGAFDGEVSLWDFSTKKILHRYRFATNAIVSLCFSRHGSSLYTGCKDGNMRIIDIASGVLTVTVKPPLLAEITGMALSPSACFLALCYKNNNTRVWDMMRNEFLPNRFTGVLNTSKNFVRCGFAQEGWLFSASEDGHLVVWEAHLSKPLASTANTLSALVEAGVVSLSQSSSGANQQGSSSLVTGAVGTNLDLQSGTGQGSSLDNPSGRPNNFAYKLALHSSLITDICVSSKRRVAATCSMDGRIVLCHPLMTEDGLKVEGSDTQ